MKKCIVDGCDNKYLCKGYCRKHYSRMYRNGKITLYKNEECNKQNWSDINIGWLAGIIEGEGYIDDTTKTSRIRVRMTDKDVIDKCLFIAGAGYINGPYTRTDCKHCKPTWEWTITKTNQVKELLYKIYPLLGKRRQEKIRNALKKM